MDPSRGASSSPSRNSEPKVALDILPLHSTNLLTVLDKSGIIRYESPSIERIYGFEQDELIGEQVAEYIHPDDRADVLTAFQAVVTSDDPVVEAIEFRHRQADGTFVWVESVASANPTPNGYYVINTRDISDQKEREQQLRATNERLDEFADIVSHDLRNPLTVAQGRVELLADDCESEQIEVIEQAHERMENLIDNLLTLSRLGTQVEETESVALAELAETCWHTVPTSDAALAIDTDQHLLAERSRLRQLLENLIRNAVEHGGADVTVTIGDLDTGFYIEDDGPGLSTNDHTQNISTTHTGTGLGLKIVNQVVDEHDWQIHHTDGTNGGARFEITDIEPASS